MQHRRKETVQLQTIRPQKQHDESGHQTKSSGFLDLEEYARQGVGK